MKTAAFKFLGVTIIAVGLFFGACAKKPTPLDKSPASNQLKHFVAEKRAQATAAAAADGKEMLPEFTTIFAAAEKGDWRTISNNIADLRRFIAQYPDKDRSTASEGFSISNVMANLRIRLSNYRDDEAKRERLRGTQWEAVLEIWGAFDCLASDEVKDNYLAALGQDIIKSIPAGSIYFGGNDAERWTVTALQASHVKGDPFFTLSQNALNDPRHLDYLRSMYGGKMYVPTTNDLQKAFSDYMEEAQRRMEHDINFPNERRQMIAGESVSAASSGSGRTSSYIGYMAINGLIAKVIFDRETNREFYVAESFPLDWMYPYLVPHGLIMKINREPLAELSQATLQANHDFWAKYTAPMIGDWLNSNTTVEEVAAFAEKTYVNHDLSGFKGDPHFIASVDVQKIFSHLRGSLGGIYSWRLGHAFSGGEVPAEYLAKNDANKQSIVREADFAYKQAFALCPSSPETVFRYIAFLVSQNRKSDALLIARTAAHLDPKNDVFQQVLNDLSR